MNQFLQFIASNFANVIQGATLIVVIIYTIYTARMTSAARASVEAANNTIKEMKEAREQENAPYIVVYFDIPQNKPLIYLIIKNVGKSIATDVKFTFTPSLSSNVFKNINDTPLIKNGISSLPPNYELRMLFDGTINRFGNANFPMTYTAEVTYAGGMTREKKTVSQVVDLSMFYNLMQVREKSLDELVKAVERIAENTGNIDRKLNGLLESLNRGVWIKNPTLAISEINPSPQRWYTSLLSGLQEFVLLWTATYGKAEEKQVGLFLTNLQNKLILISEQLIILLAESPETTSNETKEALRSTVVNLLALGYKEFYIDGGTSLADFDRLGDNTVQDIDSLVKQVLHEKEQVVGSNVEKQFD